MNVLPLYSFEPPGRFKELVLKSNMVKIFWLLFESDYSREILKLDAAVDAPDTGFLAAFICRLKLTKI